MPRAPINELPGKLKKSLGSDFLAGAVVTLATGILFMGLIQILITVWPAG
ncbi:hypothetical protein KKF84_16750 [Myxococcota bacterium]|nr:hypothetical protein [Myxococcota bacterium]